MYDIFAKKKQLINQLINLLFKHSSQFLVLKISGNIAGSLG